MKKVVASTLFLSGTCALAAANVQAGASYPNFLSFTNEDDFLEGILEEALRHYHQPFKQMEQQLKWKKIKAEQQASAKKIKESKKEDLVYVVQHGDTLSEISVRFGVSLDSLIQMNQIKNKHLIHVGQKLIIPQGEHAPPTQELGMEEGKSRVTMASRSESIGIRATVFSWPVEGSITSPFGTRAGRMHNGLDISHSQGANTPVRAAQSGTISYAAYHQGGYGNLAIIQHEQHFQTYYGHLSKLSVIEGQQVKQGEIIGYMGRSGDATGYHLHFEIRQDNIPLDPLKFLPKSKR